MFCVWQDQFPFIYEIPNLILLISMNITGKVEALELLGELQSNCGENRGRDGEYLSDQVEKIIKVVEDIDATCGNCE